MSNNQQISAVEFAKSFSTDSDWVKAMGDNTITAWKPSDKITYSGFAASIVKHCRNGMFEIRLASGFACVSYTDIKPA